MQIKILEVLFLLSLMNPKRSLAWEASSYRKPDKTSLRKTLTKEQFDVSQNAGTEPPFKNQYWDNHEAGIYVDIVSGEVLFSSKDKYDSGTGWPSFSQPLVKENLIEKNDNSFMSSRVEVRSRHADSHLGHVFQDGPAPTGLRYCMNSASLKFIRLAELEKEGYGEYLKFFGATRTDKKPTP